MTANPQLIFYEGHLGPLPYAQEFIALRRESIDLEIDSLRTQSGRWKARGVLYLTNLRLVFVVPQRDEASGLQAFDFPLAYIRNDKFVQPVFACNHLRGEVWSTQESGGPHGSFPPHKYSLHFKMGGVGTFLPLYYRFLEAARKSLHVKQRAEAVQGAMEATVATAFVDPADPSKLFLTQPVQEADRIPSAPQYAPNYGADEAYEDMRPLP